MQHKIINEDLMELEAHLHELSSSNPFLLIFVCL